ARNRGGASRPVRWKGVGPGSESAGARGQGPVSYQLRVPDDVGVCEPRPTTDNWPTTRRPLLESSKQPPKGRLGFKEAIHEYSEDDPRRVGTHVRDRQARGPGARRRGGHPGRDRSEEDTSA